MKRTGKWESIVYPIGIGSALTGICYLAGAIAAAALIRGGKTEPENLPVIRQWLTAIAVGIGGAAAGRKGGTLWYLTGMGIGLIGYGIWDCLVPTALNGDGTFTLLSCLTAVIMGAAGAWIERKKKRIKKYRKKRYG